MPPDTHKSDTPAVSSVPQTFQRSAAVFIARHPDAQYLVAAWALFDHEGVTSDEGLYRAWAEAANVPLRQALELGRVLRRTGAVLDGGVVSLEAEKVVERCIEAHIVRNS